MNKGYWVVAYRSISDESALKAYGELAAVAIAANGGTLLARTTGRLEVHEAGLQQRTVVVEFASFEQAQRTYASEAYRTALRALGTGAERDFRIVEGVDQ
ncbi:DUF1330 domain-containing protein [Collimonas sp.]|jgi:uncharacterized protein (DUF1330 family)|uniref:DUF1330 domain-containing protein n=1 Tax=Collimonas sp. TaxID=1963772 RepID=UPI002BFA16C2|nr:DUF1330 domain-containing protein [Collimonas sp.]HWX00729.1 DUF1330 domain-containing protein [Collimonas sp.]